MKKTGFTLLELLIVIAIIALLVAVILPSMKAAKENTRRVVCAHHLMSIGRAIYAYAGEYDEKIPPAHYHSGLGDVWRSYIAYEIDTDVPDDPITSGPFNFAYLYENGLIETPEVFYCPSATLKIQTTSGVSFSYDAYHDQSHDWPWNVQITSYHIYWVRTSYNYVPQTNQKKSNGQMKMAKEITQLSAIHTMVVDYLVNLDILAHKKGTTEGVNSLFGDGSVRFCNEGEAFDIQNWIPIPNSDDDNFLKILSLLR